MNQSFFVKNRPAWTKTGIRLATHQLIEIINLLTTSRKYSLNVKRKKINYYFNHLHIQWDRISDGNSHQIIERYNPKQMQCCANIPRNVMMFCNVALKCIRLLCVQCGDLNPAKMCTDRVWFKTKRELCLYYNILNQNCTLRIIFHIRKKYFRDNRTDFLLEQFDFSSKF